MRSLTALAAVALLALTAGPALAGPGRQVASGSGQLHWNDEFRNFTFHAQVDEDGAVRGKGQIHNRANDNKVRFSIDCLTITDNVATMSGVVTETTDPNFADAPVWFRVVDDGEGEDAQDVMTLVGIFTGGVGVSCGGEVLLDLLPIEGGNIHVRGERVD